MTSKNSTLKEFIILFLSILVLFIALCLWQVFTDCRAHTQDVPLPPVSYSESESTHEYDDTGVGELEAFVYEL